MTPREAYEHLAASLKAKGLLLRSGFHPDKGELFPDQADASTLYLIGNVGPSLEGLFRSQTLKAEENPLDCWTQDTVNPLAAKFQGRALYPFEGPPFHPFQQWALRGGNVYRSPLGILIHPSYGLWHAYRAALLLPGKWPLPAHEDMPNPCLACSDHPCMRACPVAAFQEKGFKAEACRTHLKREDGKPCMNLGCLSRRACPTGARYHYAAAQAQFHMEAYAANLGEV